MEETAVFGLSEQHSAQICFFRCLRGGVSMAGPPNAPTTPYTQPDMFIDVLGLPGGRGCDGSRPHAAPGVACAVRQPAEPHGAP